MRGRYCVGGLLIGAVVFAATVALTWVERPRDLTVPLRVGGRIELDGTPFGEVAFNANRLTAAFRAALAPGRYEVEAPEGRFILEVPSDATAVGDLDLRVTDRGEGEGQRWIIVRGEPSRLTFTPPVRIVDARGLSADLHEVSAEGNRVTASVEPLVGRSVANWVAERVWSAPHSGTQESPATPLREVMVTSGRLALHDGGRIHWRGVAKESASHLAIGTGSDVQVRDLLVAGTGDITSGRLSVKLTLGADSRLRNGATDTRLNGGEVKAELSVRRTAEGTQVAVAEGPPATMTLDKVRIAFTTGVRELTAEHLNVVLEQADWVSRPGVGPSVTIRSRVTIEGLTVPASFDGMRVESVTADVASGGDTVRLDNIRVRVPKAAALAAVKAALPKTIPLADQPVAANVADLFRDVKLAGIAIDPGQPKVAFEKGRIVFSCQPVARGQVEALGRHDVVTMRMQEGTGPFGIKVKTNWPYHEISWVPRVAAPFTVPFSLNGTATVDVVPGPTLAEAKLRVKTVCEAASVGEPTVEGLPGPVQPLIQLAAKFKEQIRVDGKTISDHVKTLVTREDVIPLFGSNPDPRTATALQQVTLGATSVTESGDDLVFTATVAWKSP